MPKRAKKNPHATDQAVPTYRNLTPNQVVAYNLARARELRGWTQDHAAQALEPYLGRRWSTASFSQAERSITGKVNRSFDADELLAFARAFDLPVTWFLLPPPPHTLDPERPVKLTVPDAQSSGLDLGELIDVVIGDEDDQHLLSMRLDAFLDQTGPDALTTAQDRIAGLVRRRIDALVHHSFQQLGDWQTQLRSMADQLEDLEARAKQVVAAGGSSSAMSTQGG
jgi:transcriptional regulator with XRE-family HTH domain